MAGAVASISALSVSSSVNRWGAVPQVSVSSATVSVGGDVDRHRDVDALIAPDPLLAQRLVEDPPRDGGDQFDALDIGHEAGGREEAPLGVAPTNQRLDAGDLPGRQVDLGLIVEDQLVVGEALTQVDQQRELCHQLVFVHRVEDGVAAAGPLGVVHRHVGAAQ
jgi:hypothetical protein